MHPVPVGSHGFWKGAMMYWDARVVVQLHFFRKLDSCDAMRHLAALVIKARGEDAVGVIGSEGYCGTVARRRKGT